MQTAKGIFQSSEKRAQKAAEVGVKKKSETAESEQSLGCEVWLINEKRKINQRLKVLQEEDNRLFWKNL